MKAAIPLTEKQFMGTVIELARALGYHTYHPWLSIRSERGWPDLAMVRGGDRPRAASITWGWSRA